MVQKSNFVMNIEKFTRRRSCEVRIGTTLVGGENPIVVQSMTNTYTADVEASKAQVERIADSGAPIVRLTAQGEREGRALADIVSAVRRDGYSAAIVADVHFVSEVAAIAALSCDKVRINPGNYRNDAGQFEALVELCRQRGVALRIGVNHGSLARHIFDKYGDTPEGMVASAMEFLEECRRLDFNQVVVSMKSSNTRVMLYAYRQLVEAMEARGMCYPIHLGVTEAGNGIEGRIKSAVGIGALLADGIGDTLRVSLTERPENEVPVGRLLVEHFASREGEFAVRNPQRYSPLQYRPLHPQHTPIVHSEINDRYVVCDAFSGNPTAEWRASILNAAEERLTVIRRRYDYASVEEVAVRAAADMGSLLLDGLADGVWVDAPQITAEQCHEIELMILQAARCRFSHTEYIACPSCGRTLYDIEGTLAAIKARTSHLKGLKIGVMGCIVNGPGEMADADYGYVGAAAGRITLYKGSTVVERNIPQEEALDHLIELIKANGDWQEA